MGLRTADSGGAKGSDDKLIAAALLDPAIVKDSDTEVEGVWTIRFSSPSDLYVGWDKFLAGKFIDIPNPIAVVS